MNTMKPLGDTVRVLGWDDLPPSVRSIPDDFNPLAEGVLMKHQQEWAALKSRIKLCAKTFVILLHQMVRNGKRTLKGHI